MTTRHRCSSALILAGSIAALLSTQPLHAASQTWAGGSGANGNWSTGANWSGGAAPGSTSLTTSTDIATFNAAISNTWGNSAANPIVIDSATQNIRGITFGTAAGNYFIGTTGGNALRLSSGGTILMASGLTGTNVVETINAPLIIQGANGTYNITNQSVPVSGVGSGNFNIGGSITGGAAGNTVLNLNLASNGISVNSISGPISNGAATTLGVTINQVGRGTWDFSGTNAYTGPTIVRAGTLKFTGNSAATTGEVRIAGSTFPASTLEISGPAGALGTTTYTLVAGFGGANLNLDNTTTAGGNNNNRIADTAGISMSGSNLTFKGADALNTNSSEKVGALTLGAPSIKTTVLTVTYGGTNAATLTADSLTRTSGAPVLFLNGTNLGKDATSTTSVGRVISNAAPLLVGTTAATATGINAANKNTQIVPFVVGSANTASGGLGTSNSTNGNTFVTYHPATGFRPLNPTDEFVNNSIVAGSNTRITTPSASGVSTAINSLILTGGNLAIADGQTLTDSSGALLFTGNSEVKPANTTGALTFGNNVEGMVTVVSASGSLVTATISAVIAANGVNALTKGGTSTLALTGANTYTGKTTVGGGTLSFSTIRNINGGASALGNPGDALSGTIDLTGTLEYTGATTSSDRPIRLVSGLGVISGVVDATIRNSGSGVLTLTGGITGVNQNSVGFSGNQEIVETGVISNGVGLLVYSGPGKLTLTNAANNFTGGVSVNNGTLSINSISNAGSPSALGQGATITLGINAANTSGTLQFTGASGGASSRNINIIGLSANTNGGIIENTVVGQALTLSGTVSGSIGPGTAPLLQLVGAGNGVLSGVISDGTNDLKIVKAGTGTWTFSNTNSYSGGTVLSGGVLSVAAIGNGGANGNLGAATNAATNLVFDGGTLRYTGATASTDRNFTITAGKTATVEVTTNNLTVAGASTATSGALTKTGAGTLTLTDANLYSGNTTVSRGTLALSGSGSFAASPQITVATGATLDVSGVTGGANHDGIRFAVVNGQTLTSAGTVLGALDVSNGGTIAGGGTFAGAVTLNAGGQLEPGLGAATAQTMTAQGNVTFNGASIYQADIFGGTLSDLLNIGGNAAFNGALTVGLPGGTAPAWNQTFRIANVSGTRTGTFGLTEGQSVGNGLRVTFTAGDGNDVALTNGPTPGAVPVTSALPNQPAFAPAGYSFPNAGTTYSYGSLDIKPGDQVYLGPNDTIALTNGPLTVQPGAIFSGNGIIQGNVINYGLVRIPIVRTDTLSKIHFGYTIIEPPPVPPIPGPPGPPIKINPGTGVGFGGGGGGGGGGGFVFNGDTGNDGELILPPPTPIPPPPGPPVPVRYDASLEITGTYTQGATGKLRLFIGGDIRGETYSTLNVGKAVTLDGEIQLVLQPELFNFLPTPGETFDLIESPEGISFVQYAVVLGAPVGEPFPTAGGLRFSNFVTQAGASDVPGLTLSPYTSGFSNDPDALFRIGEELFTFDLVENNTILRATYVGPAFVPEPSNLLYAVAALLPLIRRKRKG